MALSQAKRERITRLYQIYSSNLSLLAPELKDVFGCPLCFGIFGRDALDAEFLTEEHIIPRKLGGKLTTLTCKDCNNQDGSRLDSHLVNEFRTRDKIAGLCHSPLKGRVETPTAKQDVEIYLSNPQSPGLLILGDPKRSNPKSVQSIMRTMEEDSKNVSFILTSDYNPLNSQVAKLRAAYLLMFYYFGYEYIAQESVKLIRQQILSTEKDLIASKAVLDFRQTPDELNSVGLIHTPSDLRCFIVSLKLSTEIDRSFGVVLPGLGKGEETIYDRWYAQKDNLRGLEFDGTYFLTNRETPIGHIYKGLITAVWNNLK
jgi:hypothetical protein